MPSTDKYSIEEAVYKSPVSPVGLHRSCQRLCQILGICFYIWSNRMKLDNLYRLQQYID